MTAKRKKAASRIARPGGKRTRELSPAEQAFIASVGKRIAEIRVAKGITAKELAESLGVSVGTQSRREQGHQSMPLEDLHRYAAALSVAVSDVIS
jgi:DNA-binding Xre family transcriptional regulator